MKLGSQGIEDRLLGYLCSVFIGVMSVEPR